MKKYCIVGTGGRGIHSYAEPLVKDYSDCAELVGVYDINWKRAELVSEITGKQIPVFRDFDEMIHTCKPDAVIVTTKDCEHSTYAIRAMELGCDVISEKPLTTDAEKCAAILEAERRTGKKVIVTFNCRFFPFYVRIKELLMQNVIGDILSVHFEWLLDTRHGADYFRRWHAERKNSGSLLIHKSTHHFDLVNWFLDDEPRKVNAFGTRRFYGPTREQRSERCLTCPYKKSCEFYVDLAADPHLKSFYLDCEDVDGYYRDQCVFGDRIDIEDSVSVSVKYAKGTVMSYSLTAHSPYECMKIVFNGTKGRMEADTAFGGKNLKVYNREGERIDYVKVDERIIPGGHGGSDTLMRDNIFRGYTDDPLEQMAGTRAGAMSIGIGIAANMSMKEDRAVYLKDFLGKYYDI
ncbi:MAG: Gfo/Idh/MocA family oxidoreductase [Clostridiaceae bacterium]|nr:Gfo/Idh/MocA family oxidoreductase [Clostridiaceae bacterium]